MPDLNPDQLAARVSASRNQDHLGKDFYGPGDPMDPLEGLALWKMLLWGLLLIPVLERLYALRAWWRK